MFNMLKKTKKKKNKGKQPIERSSFTDLPIERSSFTTDLPMGRVSTANLVEQSVEDSRETKALKDNIWREEFKTRDLNREKLQRLLWRRFGDGNFTMKDKGSKIVVKTPQKLMRSEVASVFYKKG